MISQTEPSLFSEKSIRLVVCTYTPLNEYKLEGSCLRGMQNCTVNSQLSVGA